MPRLPACHRHRCWRVSGCRGGKSKTRACVYRFADQVEFLNLVAAAAGDELLGLHLAQHCELRELGLFYYVLASSATLFDVCQRAARFSAMINEGAVQKFIDGRLIGIALNFTGVSRHHDRQQVEFWFATVMRMLRKLTGVHLIPQRVRLAPARMRGAREISATSAVPSSLAPASTKCCSSASWATCPW